MKIYFGNFNSQEDMVREFSLTLEQLEGVEILYASYDHIDYEGYAHVIFRKEGKLFEVNDSHCSCNGLDNWHPEETTVAALLFRPNVSEDAKAILRLNYKISEIKLT